MKKLFLTIILCAAWVAVTGQTYDTIYNRAVNGYYHRWYDTCSEFYNRPNITMINLNLYTPDSMSVTVISKFTPQPMTITGGIIMVYMDDYLSSSFRWEYDRVKPEYLLLYQRDAEHDTMILIDSARWDTVTPKIMKFPRGADTARYGFKYCYGYEVKFKSPVTVDSTFYMGGTQNNNVWVESGPYAPGGYYRYKPVEYCKMDVTKSRYSSCIGDTSWCYNHLIVGEERYRWHMHSVQSSDAAFGGVIPTVDTFRLEVATSDTGRGRVAGGGTYINMTLCTISATAEEGYRFAHWNDGNRDNPRLVLLTQDTLFTAYFIERDQIWVDARSNDNSRGTVTGGGAYYEGDTATLTPLPQPYNKFVCWDDSVCDNPRQVVLTQDTVFTAVFAPLERYVVEAVANNSGRGRVTGGGEYYEGDTVTLTALPWTSFGFLQWDDGDTSNPRHFVLTQDTVFTAVFVSRNGIEKPSADGTGFQLQPNPAREQVAVTLAEGATDVTVLTVSDAAGREVLRRELAPGTQVVTFSVAALPAGTYFVTLTTPTGTCTRKLVVE